MIVKGGSPCGNLDPTMNKSYNMILNLVQDLFNIFDSKYIHLGGDEVNYYWWDKRPSILDFSLHPRIASYSAKVPLSSVGKNIGFNGWG